MINLVHNQLHMARRNWNEGRRRRLDPGDRLREAIAGSVPRTGTVVGVLGIAIAAVNAVGGVMVPGWRLVMSEVGVGERYFCVCGHESPSSSKPDTYSGSSIPA